MMTLNKTIIILVSMFFLVSLGVFIGVRIYDNNIDSQVTNIIEYTPFLLPPHENIPVFNIR